MGRGSSPALPAALVAGVLAEGGPPQEQQRQQGGQPRPEHVDVAAHFASSGVKLRSSPPPWLQLRNVSMCPRVRSAPRRGRGLFWSLLSCSR